MAQSMHSRIAEVTLKNVAEVEELAEEILSDRAQIVDYDKKRNFNREAANALKKLPTGGKEWICIGNLFLRLPHKQVLDDIVKDQKAIDFSIKKVQDGLKAKVKKLHELEGLPAVSGFDLVGVTSDDIVRDLGISQI